MAQIRRRRPLRRFCILSWQRGGLIAWFWGRCRGWGPSERAVFFVRQEDAEHECLRIHGDRHHEGFGTPMVVEVGRFNKKYGKHVVPTADLVR